MLEPPRMQLMQLAPDATSMNSMNRVAISSRAQYDPAAAEAVRKMLAGAS